MAVAPGGIGSRKGKVVNDKGNLRWRFPVNSEVGRTARGYCYITMLVLLFSHQLLILEALRLLIAETTLLVLLVF